MFEQTIPAIAVCNRHAEGSVVKTCRTFLNKSYRAPCNAWEMRFDLPLDQLLRWVETACDSRIKQARRAVCRRLWFGNVFCLTTLIL